MKLAHSAFNFNRIFKSRTRNSIRDFFLPLVRLSVHPSAIPRVRRCVCVCFLCLCVCVFVPVCVFMLMSLCMCAFVCLCVCAVACLCVCACLWCWGESGCGCPPVPNDIVTPRYLFSSSLSVFNVAFLFVSYQERAKVPVCIGLGSKFTILSRVAKVALLTRFKKKNVNKKMKSLLRQRKQKRTTLPIFLD